MVLIEALKIIADLFSRPFYDWRNNELHSI